MKGAYLPFNQAYPEHYVLDPAIIGTDDAEKAKAVCKYDAIDLDMSEEESTITVGAIIWATGWRPYDAGKIQPYGYDRYKNVITSVEFERMLELLKSGGFNVVYCPYTDWRHELFKKHDMKMMVDVLIWKGPVQTDIRKLAQRESARIKRDRTYRSDIKTLRKLTSCDMHLTLPASRKADFFDEEWLITSSMLASRSLAAAVSTSREQSANRVAAQLARDINLRSLHRWSPQERRAFVRIAPIVAAVSPAMWPGDEKRGLRVLLRAKGGNAEARYARLLSESDRLLKSLIKTCQRAESE